MSKFWPEICAEAQQRGLLILDKKILILLREKKPLLFFLPGMGSCLEVQHPSCDHKAKAQNDSAESPNKSVSLKDPVTVTLCHCPGLDFLPPDFTLYEKNKSLCVHFFIHRKELVKVSLSQCED